MKNIAKINDGTVIVQDDNGKRFVAVPCEHGLEVLRQARDFDLIRSDLPLGRGQSFLEPTCIAQSQPLW